MLAVIPCTPVVPLLWLKQHPTLQGALLYGPGRQQPFALEGCPHMLPSALHLFAPTIP